MENREGHLVYGSARLSEEEEGLLKGKIEKVNKQFPESSINMNNFLDMALRIGIDIELRAIREEMEADRHVKPE